MLRFTPLLLLLGLAACDATAPGVTPPIEEPSDVAVAPLRALSVASFRDDTFDADLFGNASISSFSSPTGNQDAALSTSRSGLWAGGLQSGSERASTVYYGETNFESACGEPQNRLFALDSDTTYTDTEAWPRDVGAPVTADGAPRVYGDRMLWGSFCSKAYTFSGEFGNRHADPLDLQLNVAVYAYDRPDLERVRFIRYEVTNAGASPIQDLRIGHFSDAETPGRFPNEYARYSSDAVGYDAASGMSYVYQLPFQTPDGETVSSTFVMGYAFLDMPPAASLRSHRILRRYASQEPEGFGPSPRSATEVLRALDGLSFAGDPMIDPTTGSPSRFAFHTAPFEQTTGWLDGRAEDGTFRGSDVRQLLSVGTTTLAPGETTVYTLVSVSAVAGPTSADSFRRVQDLLSTVRAEPLLWDFASTGT